VVSPQRRAPRTGGWRVFDIDDQALAECAKRRLDLFELRAVRHGQEAIDLG
jgi:hypothetical protein